VKPVQVVMQATTGGAGGANPCDVKLLSDIDDMEGMQFCSSNIHLYRNNSSSSKMHD
jgi:hypothetical protein